MGPGILHDAGYLVCHTCKIPPKGQDQRPDSPVPTAVVLVIGEAECTAIQTGRRRRRRRHLSAISYARHSGGNRVSRER